MVVELREWLESKYWDNWEKVVKRVMMETQAKLTHFAGVLEDHIPYAVLLEEKEEEEKLRRLVEKARELYKEIDAILFEYFEKRDKHYREALERRLSQ